MEIHKPKPIHNWREFLKEVGIIVLGVSIALAGEQGVEYIHWRNQVAESREFIATETAMNLANAITRIRMAPCVERRLDTLAQILDDTPRTGGSLPPVGDIGQPARRLWRDAIWESVVASQSATHLSRHELADLASIYKFVQRAEYYGGAELEAWSDLSAMVGPGRQLDPASEADLRQALSRARTYNRALTSISSIVMAQARALNLPFSSSDLESMDQALRTSLTEGTPTPTNPTPMKLICGPIGAPALHYGQAPYAALPGLMDGNVKQLDSFAARLGRGHP